MTDNYVTVQLSVRDDFTIVSDRRYVTLECCRDCGCYVHDKLVHAEACSIAVVRSLNQGLLA